MIKDVRTGFTTVELHMAAWTGISHSFIDQRQTRKYSTSDREILRADEARLLFITGSESHPRPPICPWQPFGSIPSEYADIEVRKHAICADHGLWYRSWRWDTVDGMSLEDEGLNDEGDMGRRYTTSTDLQLASVSNETQGPLKSTSLSEMATRSLFSWLRVDGYPPVEKAIFNHEWFDVGESSDESAGSIAGSPATPITEQSDIKKWLERVE